MEFKELLEKYDLLLNENIRLAEENSRLKARLGVTEIVPSETGITAIIEKKDAPGDEFAEIASLSDISNSSDTGLKITLFMSLFKGRHDVYARRWENKKKETSGYSPACLNQWQAGLCGKPKVSCAKCVNQSYAPLDEHAIEDHLRGNIVAGIYPMLPDETCCFLAIDFDEAGWQDDISTVRNDCAELDIPFAVERSRSGNGGHLWFFFENPLSAVLARKFGTALVTYSMTRRHEIHFKSYDRMFPSQDTMPKGGFGNLIALPLQKEARTYHNSEFIGENFESYGDQRALNRLKRLASFKNPMFYRRQAMRLSTYGHARVISCADETKGYLCLPRGCEIDLSAELEQLGIDARFIDKTNCGKKIDVEFNGHLRDEQPLALEQLLQHDTGILSGTTAFGKTVVAIKLIAERKVNTLILVDKVGLLSQWMEKLSQFLIVNEALPETITTTGKKKGRKKKISVIGQLGAGKNTLGGIVDVAVMQSLSRDGDVKDYVKNYGMIIADECHHASAVTYEKILKTATARYIYGLTATPARKDGHHPILFMHCGPIRYRDNAKIQAEKRPFDHFVIPRFTSLRVPLDKEEKEVSIQEMYSEILDNGLRNQQIIDDVLNNYRQGRNCLILSLRTAHVETLAKTLREEVPDVMTLTGGMGTKTTREVFKHIIDAPADKNLILVATGSFIGEGFDEPRLDTLFLAMPISWKGTLQQYAGRLHRLFHDKKEVRIYDYVDIHVKMLERMYQKRLTGYASMGYKAKGEDVISAPLDIIFDNNNFLPVFNQDIAAAKKEILIVSPFIRIRRTLQMLQHLKSSLENKIRVIVVTRPVEDFKAEERTALQTTLDLLNNSGISVVFKSNIHQKFAVMDLKTVWYGSINLLSYGSAQESIMRIESSNIANELIKSLEKP